MGKERCSICEGGYRVSTSGTCVKCDASQIFNTQTYRCEIPYLFDLYKATELIAPSQRLTVVPTECLTDSTNIDKLNKEVFTVPMYDQGDAADDSNADH